MFSNTLSFLSFRNVSDHISHPYKKKTGKIIVLYILTFKFLDSNQKCKYQDTQNYNIACCLYGCITIPK